MSKLDTDLDDRLDDRSWRHDPWDDPDQTDAIVLERPRRSFRSLKNITYTAGALGIVAVLVLGAIGLWYVRQVNPSGAPGPAVNFTVDAGDTVETISLRLQDEGLITNARVFRYYVEHNGGLEITPGYYQLRPRDHMGNLLRVLRTPPELTYTKVTFPEGFTLEKMAARMADKVPRFSAEDFLAAANDPSIPSLYRPAGTTSLEGLLFPDTYQVSNGESEGQVVARMVALMERVGRQENIEQLGYVQGLTAYQVLIVASMVEREAKTDADRPLIARVILNRFHSQTPFPLAIDATLYYQQDPDTPFSVLKALDTPYNTYLHAGLPPTPIANPGRASIEAVLNPAADVTPGNAMCKGVADKDCHLYYYVLANEDGSHAFAVTQAQHEANVQAARDAGLL